ncbi:DUF4231 domain-containing protein [Mycoplasma hafezii]|uniref:DUF4231 domain-containing protein n=1 Tax=Mycoplasma hafezii TaxID=525886 RepID=UPI003CF0823D
MTNFYKEYLKIKKKLIFSMYIYGFLYYLLNLITILAAFYISLLAIYFLAGANGNYLGGIENNPYHDPEFLNKSGVYVIFTTIINSIVGLISGMLSFFLVNTKFQNKKTQIKKLSFEELAFNSNLANYKLKETKEKKEFYLYKRSLIITQFDRYHTEMIKGDNFYEA